MANVAQATSSLALKMAKIKRFKILYPCHEPSPSRWRLLGGQPNSQVVPNHPGHRAAGDARRSPQHVTLPTAAMPANTPRKGPKTSGAATKARIGAYQAANGPSSIRRRGGLSI